MKSGGVFYEYSILMYPAVFRCILLKYCIFAYSDVFQNVFSYLLVCDRDTLCFMYSDVFCTYSECILRRGRDTLGYILNTSRYTYPHPHTWPDPNASGILLDTTGYDRIHPLVRIPAGCTRYLQIRLEYEEDLVSASYSPHCSRSTCPAAQGPAGAPPPHRWSRARPRGRAGGLGGA